MLLIALTLAAWGRVPFGTFHFDDFASVVREPATADLAEMTAWRPLLRLSYRLDHALWGMDARGFLATNLAMHLATVLGVYALARRFFEDEVTPLLAAAIFCVQPANAEVVAYVSGRSTGLASALLVWGLALDRHRVAQAVLFIAACLAKETALIFPALVLLADWLREKRLSLVPFVVCASIAGWLVLLLLFVPRFRELAAWSLQSRNPLHNLVLNVSAVQEMLSLWVTPWALSIEHPAPGRNFIRGAGIFAALAILAAQQGRAGPKQNAPVTFAILWVFVALAPTNSVFPKADLVTEKPLYLAWVGPSIFLAYVLACWIATASTRGAHVLRAGAGCVLVIAGVFCVHRVAIWSDPELLWGDAVVSAPMSARAWNNLGMARLAHDRLPEAKAAFEHAIRLEPRNTRAQVNLHHLEILCGRACANE